MPNLRLAVRMLFRTPALTAIAILSLAIGIGANAAIFSLYNQMLLRPLPVRDPYGLVNLGAPGPKPGSQSSNQAGSSENTFSYPMFRDLEKAKTRFSGIAAHRILETNVGFKGQTTKGTGMLVSGSYFGVLGLTPAAGRLIGLDDDRTPGAHQVVVLSHGYWQTRFAMSPAIIGDTLTINGVPMTVIGVAPQGFTGTTLGALPNVFVPLSMRGRLMAGWKGFDDRRSYWAYVFARLQPGETIESARAAVNVPYRAILNDLEAGLQENMSQATMTRFRARQVTVEAGAQGQSSLMKNARSRLYLLLAVTAFVLLIACANIANLLLARGAARASEMAVRLSIGASRWQVVRQLLTESAVLAALGCALGLLIARGTLTGIIAMVPGQDTSFLSDQLDLSTLGFAAAVAVATGLLFGLFPALHSTRPDLVTAIKSTAGQPSGARAASRFRIALATTQIALSTMLLILAGLFTKSLVNITRVDLGIQAEKLVTFSLSPARNGYTPERSKALFERVEDELAALPGVSGAGAGVVPLLAGNNWGSGVMVTGMTFDPDADAGSMYNEISPGFFGTVGMRLLAGRDFTRGDILGGPKVAIVNQAFARKFKITGREIGTRMATERSASAKLDIEIVGVVEDSLYEGPREGVHRQVFWPGYGGSATFYARTTEASASAFNMIRSEVKRLDAGMPVYDVKTVQGQLDETLLTDRLIALLSAGFGFLATLLASIGLYGVMAFVVARRRKEIGLRLALGAEPAGVLWIVMREVLLLLVIGLAVGVPAAIGLGRYVSSQLYGIQPNDPWMAIGTVLLLTAVSAAAGMIPATRASRIDPILALRYE